MLSLNSVGTISPSNTPVPTPDKTTLENIKASLHIQKVFFFCGRTTKAIQTILRLIMIKKKVAWRGGGQTLGVRPPKKNINVFPFLMWPGMYVCMYMIILSITDVARQRLKLLN